MRKQVPMDETRKKIFITELYNEMKLKKKTDLNIAKRGLIRNRNIFSNIPKEQIEISSHEHKCEKHLGKS